jgi:hypothetical protein
MFSTINNRAQRLTIETDVLRMWGVAGIAVIVCTGSALLLLLVIDFANI